MSAFWSESETPSTNMAPEHSAQDGKMETLHTRLILGFLLTLVIITAAMPAAVSANPVALNNWDDVIAAVDQANLDGGGTIHLASREAFVVAALLPRITSGIVIEGNGAKIESLLEYHGALLQIHETGSLELKDVTISRFDRFILQGPSPISALIDNEGELKLTRVTISNNPACASCFESLPILDNRGQAALRNVTLYKNHVRAPANTHTIANIRNCGSMRIVNSTFAENTASIGIGIAQAQHPVPAAISAYISSSCGPGFFEIGNTLFENNSGNCGEIGELNDLGGNFDSDNSCGFDLARNVANKPSKLARFGLQGGLIPTVGLEPTSRAIDIGVNEICSAIDARMASRPAQTKVGVEPRCDSGAFEFAGGFGNADLSVNGMNGLWYNAATDGHYVHVMRVSPDRIYINWTAFDQSAEQLWILAVATSTDSNSFSATAYVNVGGQLIPGGAPDGHTVDLWGEIELKFDNCSVGNFRYSAHDPGFGDGQFQLDRLAFIEGVGCSFEEPTE